jgi:UDP-glucose 4-epimerase
VRIVVTGALGHIGSRLIRDIAATWPGADVVMVDNLATERYASLFNLADSCRYEFIEGDVLTADLSAIVAGADVVIHLAAITHGATGATALMRRVNVDGTERVARACARCRVPLLFPSTTSVYGVANGVVSEDCAPEALRPHSPYAAWKFESEGLLRSLGRDEGLRFAILRMGTIFGPSIGMRFHTAVNQFCWRAALRQPLDVWTTASHQFRPYLDLSDAVRAMRFMIRRGQFDGRVYNVVTLNATVTDVLNVLRAYVPDLHVAYVDSPLMNDLSYCVDGERLARLGFEMRGSLERGIVDTLAMLSGSGRKYQTMPATLTGRERGDE